MDVTRRDFVKASAIAAAMAAAENLRVIPVFVRRMRLKQGLSVILLAMALGKCIGSILQFFFEGT